ncbi:MAG: inositol monophosphatase [Armatimonadetes bacterium]|nr:inositol monophosphatase [Armatimonadota bacterium]
MTAEAELLAGIARRAGQMLLDYYGRVTARSKPDESLVSDADQVTERYIREALRAAFPGDRVLGEEYGDSGSDGNGRQWFIDPLDGTTNFLHRIPFWCTAIGLLEGGVARLGVIYQPLLDELYLGGTGLGAWRNADRLGLTPNPEPFTRNDPVALPSLVTGPKLRFGAPYRARMLGSAQLHFALLAAGGLRAGLWRECYGWDLVAGIAICQAAGALVTMCAGEEPELDLLSDGRLQPWAVCASDPGTHPRLLAAVEALAGV